MKLRRRILSITWLAWLAAVGAALAAAPALGTNPFWLVVPVAMSFFVARKVIGPFVVRQAYRDLARRMDAEDYPGARVLLADLQELYAGSYNVTESLRLQEGTIRSLEGRYAEAASLLASLDAARLGRNFKPLLLNNLAWALALSGDPLAGVEKARESMAASERAGDRAVMSEDLRGYQLGTLGTALVLAGQAGEGVPLLEQALARGGKGRAQAARAFFLGEGLRALGRHQEATRAYGRAVDEAPDGEFGQKARAALEGLRAYRS